MRLICPNCGAQYEVDASVIPPSGRDVQCSSCGKTWFEEPGGPTHGDDSEAVDASMPQAQGLSPAADGTDGNDGADAGDGKLRSDAENIPHRPFAGQPDDAYDEDYQDTRPSQTRLHTSMPWGKAADDAPQPNTAAPDAATAAASGSIAATAAATASSAATVIPPHAAMTSRATGTAFQTPPGAPMTAQDAVPPRRTITPAIADILRAEAAREEAARRAEAGGIESQPELGLDAALARPPAVERPDARSGTSVDAPAATEPDAPQSDETQPDEKQRRLAMLRGEPVPPAEAPATDRAGTRRELLPDIEEINSTLRPADERTDTADAADPAQAEVVQRRGFRIGFGTVIILAVALAALYSYAPRVSDAVPGAQPVLTQYVATVDDARIWLDEQIRSMLDRMNAQDG